MKLSARNRIPATVVAITRGEAIANVELDPNGQRIVSSITVEAVSDLAWPRAPRSWPWSRPRT